MLNLSQCIGLSRFHSLCHSQSSHSNQKSYSQTLTLTLTLTLIQGHIQGHNSHMSQAEHHASVFQCSELPLLGKLHSLLACCGRFHPYTTRLHLGRKKDFLLLFFLLDLLPLPRTVAPHCPGKAPLHLYSGQLLSFQKVGWEQTVWSLEKKSGSP